MFYSLKRTHLEVVDLFLGKVAPTTAGEILLGETCKVNSVEFGDVITKMLEYTAHDAVATRVDLDTGLIAVGLGGIGDGIGMDMSILKLYTVGYALHVLLGYVFVGPHVVDLLLDKLGVGEFGCKVTIVGEQEHTGGVAVQTADGVYALLARTLDEIHHSEASVGVVACGDAVLGLVEKYVAFLLERHYLLVIFHYIAVGDLGAELGDNLAVHLDETLEDVFIGFAARAQTCVGHVFVKTYLLVGIGQRSLVFHTFGTRSEAAASLRHAELILARVLLITTLLTVVISALAVIVVSALLTVVVVSALLVVIVVLTVVVSALTRLIAGLARLVSALIVARLVATLIIARLISALVVARLVATLTVVIVSTLAGLVSALTGLIA